MYVQGDRGADGERGMDGVLGEKGLPGTRGQKGDQGIQGTNGSMGNMVCNACCNHATCNMHAVIMQHACHACACTVEPVSGHCISRSFSIQWNLSIVHCILMY